MLATVWMLGAVVSFCLMAIGVREISGEISAFQALFVRSLIGLLVISTLLVLLKKQTEVRFERAGLHVFRNCFHFAGQYGWFIGIGLLPLAEVFALEFTTPVWTAIIAALFIGERFTWQKAIALILGILGVLVILRPGIEIFNPASLIVLAAAACYGASHTAAKSLSTTESALAILFFMCVVQLPFGLVPSLFVWVWPDAIQWFWMTVIGFAALSAHFCLVKAMTFSEVSKIVLLDFLRLPMIAVVGVLFYQEGFEFYLILGALIMLIGNWIATLELGLRRPNAIRAIKQMKAKNNEGNRE